MLGRELHRSCAENGIYARCKDADGRARRPESFMVFRVIEFEIDQRAFAAADPVALHGADLFRPAFQLVEIAQQLVGVFGDAQEPLLQLTLFHERIFVTPAASVDHLLIRQHRRALRTPVDSALLAIRQTLLVELEKEPLVPAVIVRQAGGNLAGPVVAKAEAVHLRLHFGDVAQGPLAWRRVVLNRRIFRRQTKGIPAHGMEHVVPVHPHVAGQRVADRIVTHVSHVQRAGGIGQHFEDVVFLLGGVGFGGVEAGIALPALEPLRFHALRVVAVVVSSLSAAGDGALFLHLVLLRHREIAKSFA